MEATESLLPKSVLKIALVLGVFALLYLGKALLIPLVVAALLALILNPLHQWVLDRGGASVLATTVSLSVLVLVFGGLFFAVGSQGARFAENLPQIQERVYERYQEVKDQLATQAGADPSETQDSKVEPSTATSNVSTSQATSALQKLAGVVGNFLLMLVYVALLLSHKERIHTFILRRTADDNRQATEETIEETVKVAQQYLRGRLILIGILTVLYSAGFMIVGLDYAIVIALLAATLSIIPYVGNIIGGVIALALAFAGGAENMSQQIYGIVITIGVAQFLESYFLTPLIVGKEVSINPLATIIGVIGFNILWGPVGAIVAIPIVAMLKILFSHLPPMEDYAYLLGDE